jgi:hypothetical protein
MQSIGGPEPKMQETNKNSEDYQSGLIRKPRVSKRMATDNQANNKVHVVPVALIEAISKLFWPVVACWALLMFEKPIYDVVNATANQISDGGTSIEIHGLKITLPKNAIPSAPERVKDILPKIDSEMIAFIIANTGGDNTLDICYGDGNLDEFKEGSVSSRLKKLGMITFEREQGLFDKNGEPCPAGSKTGYTDLYKLVIRFPGN